jgi:cobalt-zinc-cadmium efflux system membrane fusion protein
MSRPLTLTASLLLALSLPVAAGDKMFTLSPAQRAALKLSVAPLSAHAGAVTVGLPARVVIPPAQERLVTAPVAGMVTELRVAAGDPVRLGQTLAVLRGESLIGAQRELAQAAVQAQLARESVRRDEALFQEGIISESRLQSARAQLAQSEAALRERRAWLRLMGLSEAAVKLAERGERLADSVSLAAPMDGVVMEVPAVVGARVETTAPLLRLARLDPLWLEIQAPAEVAALVRKGQGVSVPGTAAKGSVLSVGRGVSEAQTVPIRARIEQQGWAAAPQSECLRPPGRCRRGPPVAGAGEGHRAPGRPELGFRGAAWRLRARAGQGAVPVGPVGGHRRPIQRRGEDRRGRRGGLEGCLAGEMTC